MTYRKFVENLAIYEARDYIEGLMKKANIQFDFTEGNIKSITPARDSIDFNVNVTIYRGILNRATLSVFGYLGDYGNTCYLVKDSIGNYLWVNSKRQREQLGITEFKI